MFAIGSRLFTVNNAFLHGYSSKKMATLMVHRQATFTIHLRIQLTSESTPTATERNNLNDAASSSLQGDVSAESRSIPLNAIRRQHLLVQQTIR